MDQCLGILPICCIGWRFMMELPLSVTTNKMPMTNLRLTNRLQIQKNLALILHLMCLTLVVNKSLILIDTSNWSSKIMRWSLQMDWDTICLVIQMHLKQNQDTIRTGMVFTSRIQIITSVKTKICLKYINLTTTTNPGLIRYFLKCTA